MLVCGSRARLKSRSTLETQQDFQGASFWESGFYDEGNFSLSKAYFLKILLVLKVLLVSSLSVLKEDLWKKVTVSYLAEGMKWAQSENNGDCPVPGIYHSVINFFVNVCLSVCLSISFYHLSFYLSCHLPTYLLIFISLVWYSRVSYEATRESNTAFQRYIRHRHLTNC